MRRKSVRLEVLTVFLIFTVIMMGVSLMIYNQNIGELRQADINHLMESGKQLAYSVDSIILDVGSLFNLHYQDQRMCNIINHRKSQYDEVTRFQNTTYVEGTINHVVSNSKYIKRCCIFSANGDVYSNISSVFQDYKDYIWEIVDSGKIGHSIYYTDPSVWSIGQVDYKVVTAVKVLYSYNGTSPLAYVTLDISYAELDRLLNSTDNPAGTLLFYEDMQIYNNGKGGLYGEQLTQVQEKAKQMVEEGREQDILRIGGLDYLMTAIRSESSGWTVVRFIAEKEALRSISERKVRDITILLVTAAVVFMIYYYRVNQLMDPLTKMDEVIRHNKGTSLAKVYLSKEEEWLLGNNEIRNVIQNYNSMADRINEYAEKTLLYEIDQKEAQIKMLTYQINPHFLYNTLDAINWLAMDSGRPEISSMVQSLATLFREATKQQQYLIPLREELTLLSCYVTIQKIRLEERLEVAFTIPEECMDMKIPKLSLQPILENSVKYAAEVTMKPCLIEIRARRKGNRLILCIWDNGPGIPEQILAQIRERRVPDNTGIGLLNIEDRIQMLGGTGSGLKIYSKKGQGTWITLCICQPGGEGS